MQSCVAIQETELSAKAHPLPTDCLACQVALARGLSTCSNALASALGPFRCRGALLGKDPVYDSINERIFDRIAVRSCWVVSCRRMRAPVLDALAAPKHCFATPMSRSLLSESSSELEASTSAPLYSKCVAVLPGRRLQRAGGVDLCPAAPLQEGAAESCCGADL